MRKLEASITLCDHLNPGFGYQIKITDGPTTILFTSKHPDTGVDLLTFEQCLDVLDTYRSERAS